MHGEVERRMRFLRHDGDLLRDGSRATAAGASRSPRRDRAKLRLEHAGQQLQQRRLAAAVRAEQAGQRAAARC